MASFRVFAAGMALILCAGSLAAEDAASIDALLKGTGKADALKLTSLATQYEHAEGVPRDYAKAIALYCAAARLGHANAQHALGWMYAHGRGVSKDEGVAVQFFSMAASQGHEQARAMLRYLPTDTTAPLPACLLPGANESADGETELAGPEIVYPKGPIFHLVHKLAPRYDIDPQLALAVILIESGFNPQAVSPKNAQGLMQLMPDTAQRFRVKNPFDAEDNIKGGLAYLQWLMALFRGNVSLVAAAYNAGERAVEHHRGVPPYPETRNYVKKIARLYRKSMHPFKENLVQASPIVVQTVAQKNEVGTPAK